MAFNSDDLNRAFRDLGTSKEEQNQKMCEVAHAELASLKQIAIRADGSDETKKARKTIQTLALLLDGESGILDYLLELRNEARAGTSDSA
jgi:hypothetical protein